MLVRSSPGHGWSSSTRSWPRSTPKLDAYKDQHVRQVLTQLWRVAREEDCAVARRPPNRVPSSGPVPAHRQQRRRSGTRPARSCSMTPEGEDDAGLRLIAQRKANLSRLAPVERHQLEEMILPDTLDPETGKPIVTSPAAARRGRHRR